MTKLLHAPWTAEQVECLNSWQSNAHPYTCGGPCRGNGLEGAMVAEPSGWRCPGCGYRQGWALASAARRWVRAGGLSYLAK